MTAARQQGAVLVLVTWVLAVIAIAAFGISRETRNAVAVATFDVRIAQARAAAEAGIWRGLFELLKPSISEPWQTNGTPYEFNAAAAHMRVSIQDQTGLVDINTASPALLKALISVAGDLDVDSDAVVDAILDWRDRDDLTRPLGAEDRDYEGAGYDYGAKDAPLNVKEELQQVAGMNRDTYAVLAAYITVHGQNQRISLKSAPPHTLALVPGLTDADAQEIEDARMDGSTTNLGAVLGRTGKQLARLQPGNTFEIQAEATIAEITQRLSAVVLIDRKSPGGYEILGWRAGYDAPPEITESDQAGI